MFALRETSAVDNNPEPGRQYLRDTFGQGYWGKREGFVLLREWLAALGEHRGDDRVGEGFGGGAYLGGATSQ